MNQSEPVQGRPKQALGKFGMGVYIAAVAWVPLAVLEWYIHRYKDGLGTGLLLYLVTLVGIAGTYSLLVRNRLRRSARLAGDGRGK
jgi:hypothetical protein